jgi:hypothetical protein
MRWPNASLRRAYSTATSCARRTAPSQRMQWVSRAGDRRTCAYLYPLPASPRMSAAGTRRPSKRTTPCPPGKQVSRLPIERSTLMPGALMSDRNIVAPSSSILAITIASVAPAAPVMNHLPPLIT